MAATPALFLTREVGKGRMSSPTQDSFPRTRRGYFSVCVSLAPYFTLLSRRNSNRRGCVGIGALGKGLVGPSNRGVCAGAEFWHLYPGARHHFRCHSGIPEPSRNAHSAHCLHAQSAPRPWHAVYRLPRRRGSGSRRPNPERQLLYDLPSGDCYRQARNQEAGCISRAGRRHPVAACLWFSTVCACAIQPRTAHTRGSRLFGLSRRHEAADRCGEKSGSYDGILYRLPPAEKCLAGLRDMSFLGGARNQALGKNYGTS
jgi:hypothetical protein